MLLEIKNKIESELARYPDSVDKAYGLKGISPLLYAQIKDFIRAPGKRVRPLLFCIGYLGFARKTAKGLYQSAVSIELLHDFMLIHDDIIDKSALRRGKPSMHTRLNTYLTRYKGVKFSGEDLSIVIGDVIYAMALHAFLSIKEDARRKEMALKKLIEAAFYTGSGEFIELLLGAKSLEKVKKEDVYKIYDLKTANYTFASPLVIGATLAGAGKKDVALLAEYGKYLGRAFQIKDDIQGIFEEEHQTGKSNLADLKEAKKTILIWQAFRNADSKDRRAIKGIFMKKIVKRTDLIKIRGIISRSGAFEFAKKEIRKFLHDADELLEKCAIKSTYKKSLRKFSYKLLNV
ncbi:MAG: polyprenyl synthetase family protein [Candidatus Omnitrophica bacterium]|nr:polyprenyl synthetase family protein [Candidatus Omnitrophota bacterium]MDD5236405.1 polyprenyl synthetase family protein [Candidatus Omnitrophota bacterium]MDD5611288.1 polyprenyl synthetase family protein [Candidatus Omnitrophota bacterium]